MQLENNNINEKHYYLGEVLRVCNIFLFINGGRNFGLLAILSCPAVHILCVAILGGWKLDRLPPRRLFELVAATQCSF
jgi:hypothetical protein